MVFKKKQPKYIFSISTDEGGVSKERCDALAVLGISGEHGIAYNLIMGYDRITGKMLLYNLFRMLALLQLASEEIGKRIRKLVPDMSQEDFKTGLRLAMEMIRTQMKDAEQEEQNETID